jgi:hypothetical protein
MRTRVFARKALSEFAQQLELPNVEPGMDEPTYVERICSSLQIPNWKVNPHFVKTTVQRERPTSINESVASQEQQRVWWWYWWC